MQYIHLMIFVVVFNAISPCSLANAQDNTERLYYGTLPGFVSWKQVTDENGKNGWLREFVPSEQEVSAYKDMWVIQAFVKLKDKNPGKFLTGMFKGAGRSCEAVRVNGPKEMEEAEYSVAYGQLYCGQQKGESFGVNLFVKVISGKDALYVVQREFRVAPSKIGGVQSFGADQLKEMGALIKTQGEANQFLSQSVYVCALSDQSEHCQSIPPEQQQKPANN
jgi:hypothetical protein